MIRNNIVTYATTLGGALLTLFGLLGFCLPNLLGLQLGAAINLLHLVSGALTLYLGLTSSSVAAARTFCLGIGALYGLVGLVGFVVGGIGTSLLHITVGTGFLVAALIQPLRSSIYSSR